MCGFVTAAGSPGDLPDTERGLDALTHRGPDERGSWNRSDGRLRMSQCRLSIIDPASGHQPMTRGGSSIVFNGELYNYRTLRDRLGSHGYDFRTDSDTEVFLQGYREWGTDLFDRVRGMFAVVVWDDDAGELVLARDHVGQKPLYYYQGEEEFVAASEVQGLLAASGEVSRRADPASLSWYLSLGYVPSPRSGFADVKTIPPGHYMKVSGTEVRRQVRYWDPVSVSRSGEEVENPTEAVRETLRTAVKRRLISDVPLGAYLSGGLDSSVIVSLMREVSEGSVTTVSVGFDDETYDERDHARRVAEELETDHHSFTVHPDLEETLPSLVRHFGEPFADSSAVPSFYLAQQTRKRVKVALSGDGGDETFGGYRRYRALRQLSRIKGILPGPLLEGIQSLGDLLPEPADRRSRRGEVTRVLRFIAENSVKQYNEMVGLGFDDLKKSIARGALEKPASRGGEQWLERWFRRFDHATDPAQRASFVDLVSYLPGDLMVKTDITSMMNSLEVRSPFLDREVLELSLKLPGELKVDGSEHKAILKEAFRDDLPDETLNRSKMGFGVPLARWFRENPEADYLRSVLLEEGTGLSAIVDRSALEEVLADHREGRRDAGPFLWAMAVLNLWAREFDVRL